MIHVTLTNNILKRISQIDKNKFSMGNVHIPSITANKLRKNSKKKSSYASNKIEGNPLTEGQADAAIESDPHRHFLKPEQEVRNYFMALCLLEKKVKDKVPFSKELILEIQALVEKGASKEKIGLRGAMPPGFLFAVYDSETGNADYIPPEYIDIPELLDESVNYVNGRTARLMSGYILDLNGYGFYGIGSLEEYFAYDAEEYYRFLQMGLPALYYSGRDNPPHPEIWVDYFLRMMELYSAKVCELSRESSEEDLLVGLSYLNAKEKELLVFLIKKHLYEFAPIDVSKLVGVTSKTIINRCAKLSANGFLVPVIVKERIRSYRLSDFTRMNEKKILNQLK